MARCEDYPCCGHTSGDPCPDRDRNGNIVARCCMCDGKLKKRFRSSICDDCQRKIAHDDDYDDVRDR